MTVYNLKTPISEKIIRKLKVYDVLYITGTLITARDQSHQRVLEWLSKNKPLPINFDGSAVYHCGPILKKEASEWLTLAAGPTTSSRLESIEANFIRKTKTRVLVGKGGMGHKTTEAMAKYGAVYCVFTGGAAVLAAQKVKKVKGVEWLDLGMPEALWILEVEKFGPLIVTIDAHKNNVFSKIEKIVKQNKEKIFETYNLY